MDHAAPKSESFSPRRQYWILNTCLIPVKDTGKQHVEAFNCHAVHHVARNLLYIDAAINAQHCLRQLLIVGMIVMTRYDGAQSQSVSSK